MMSAGASAQPAMPGRRIRAAGLVRRYWPLLPVVIFLFVFFLLPVAQLLTASIVDEAGAFTAAHYSRLATTPVYANILVVTLQISLWVTLLCVVIGYAIAYLLATVSERTRNYLILLVLLPFWMSFLVRTFAWIVLLGRRGMINDLLATIGAIDSPLSLIYNMFGLLVGMTHALLPLAVLTMLPVLLSTDGNLRKAAAILGARGGETFWRVIFPLSMPGVAAAGLLVFITALGFFITPALLGGAAQTMITQVIIRQVQELLNWAFAGALSMLLLCSAIVLILIYNRILGAGTLFGADTASRAPSARRGLANLGLSAAATFVIAVLGRAGDLVGRFIEILADLTGIRSLIRLPRFALWVFVIASLAFLMLPSIFLIPMSFSGASFISWPPTNPSLKWYDAFFNSPAWVGALVRSIAIAAISAVLAMLLAVPAAFVIAFNRFFGQSAVMSVVLAPLVVPKVIIGVALFYLFAQVRLVDTPFSLVLAHTVLCIPYVLIAVLAVLKNYDVRLDHAAWTLGANRLRTLFAVTLPIIRPGLLSAFVFAFITSFDDVTIALFLSGSAATTLPKQMWVDAVLNVTPMLAAVSTITMVMVSVLILATEVIRRRVAN